MCAFVGHYKKYKIKKLIFIFKTASNSEFATENFLLLLRIEKLSSIFRGLVNAQSWISGKAVPLQAWSGPEGSRIVRFPDFMTTAQRGGKVASFTHRPHLPPLNSAGTHFC